MTEQTKEPLFAKLKRKTVNAGHTTRLQAYKTKKAAQIQSLKGKIIERKKKFGVEYMDLIEEKSIPQILRNCIETALKDLGLLHQQVVKHQNKIVAKEAQIKEKIENSIPHNSNDDDDESSSSSESGHYETTTTNQRKPAEPPKSPYRKTTLRTDSSPVSPSPCKQSPATRTTATDSKCPYRQAPSPRILKESAGTTSPSMKPTPSNRIPASDPKSPFKHTPSSGEHKERPVKLKPVHVAENPGLRAHKGKKPCSNWKLEEMKFSGTASFTKRGKQEVIKGQSIEAGIKLFKENPELYTAMYFQSNIVDWAPEEQQYTLIYREITENYKPQGVSPSGWMKLLLYTYERLPPFPDNVLPEKHRDIYTDNMKFKGKKLHNKSNKPILPGRGMGVGDTHHLKIIGDVDPSDIHQGRVGDCWLLSGISALAEFDGAVKKLFRKTKDLGSMPRADKPNFYTITLWDLSTWKEVDIVVDERLCSYEGNLLASRPSEDGELWVCYIEKAVAAHCGGWDKLEGGQCTHAWSLLTGCKHQYSIWKNPKTGKYCCHGKYNTHEGRWAKQQNSPHDGETGMWLMPWPSVGGGGGETLELTEDELFLRLVAWDKENYIVGAGTKGDSDKAKTDGLVDNHAYSVIESYDNVCGTGIGLLKVRNPWGKGEIEDGEFDDDGPGWNKYPQIKKLLKPVLADDGIFWVTKKEFFKYFQTIYLSASNMTEFLED